MRFHSSCVFDIGQSLLVDFNLCAPTRLVFLTLVSHCWWTLACTIPLVLFFFDIGHLLLVDFDLCASTRLVFFDIGHLLLVDFDLCASTRLVFLIGKQRCLDADYLGLCNRQQVGFTPFCWLSRVIQPTIGWGYTFSVPLPPRS